SAADGGGRYGGQYATVGDREGRERESGGAGGGDVRGGARERDDHRRESDHQRQRHRHGRELDVEYHGGLEHPDDDLRLALREPGDVHGHRHGRGGGHHGQKPGSRTARGGRQ